MPLTPTPLLTTLDRLVAAATRISDLVGPAFQGYSTSGDNASSSNRSSDERRQKRAVRARYELSNTRSRLEQLRRVLLLTCSPSESGGPDVVGAAAMAAERKALVQVRELVAVLGDGAAVLEALEKGFWDLRVARALELETAENKDAARASRRQAEAEVWHLLTGIELKDLAMGCWFVLTVLESTSEVDAEIGCENLRALVAVIQCKSNELWREIKALYPEPEPGLNRSEAGPHSPGPYFQSRTYTIEDLVKFVGSEDSDSDDSNSDAGPPTPSSSEFPYPDTALEGRLATLADVSCLDDILVPLADPSTLDDEATDLPEAPSDNRSSEEVSPQRDSGPLKVITVGPAGVGIKPLPRDLAPSAPQAPLSAEAVFERPGVPDKIVLDFFGRAILVSRFAPYFPLGRAPPSAFLTDREAAHRARLEAMEPPKFRQLCTDVYDELVLRNIEDQKGEERTRGRAGVSHVNSAADATGMDDLRQRARARLAALGDMDLGGFITALLAELERRSRVPPPVLPFEVPQREGRASERESWRTFGRLAESDERWSMQAMGEEPAFRESAYLRTWLGD